MVEQALFYILNMFASCTHIVRLDRTLCTENMSHNYSTIHKSYSEGGRNMPPRAPEHLFCVNI